MLHSGTEKLGRHNMVILQVFMFDTHVKTPKYMLLHKEVLLFYFMCSGQSLV